MPGVGGLTRSPPAESVMSLPDTAAAQGLQEGEVRTLEGGCDTREQATEFFYYTGGLVQDQVP